MQRYSQAADVMIADPSGEWVSVRDPLWEQVWVMADPTADEPWPDDAELLVRGDALLALDNAFRAWGVL